MADEGDVGRQRAGGVCEILLVGAVGEPWGDTLAEADEQVDTSGPANPS
ncbi:hypothetical protein [Streptomyces sp. YIM S03343]